MIVFVPAFATSAPRSPMQLGDSAWRSQRNDSHDCVPSFPRAAWHSLAAFEPPRGDEVLACSPCLTPLLPEGPLIAPPSLDTANVRDALREVQGCRVEVLRSFAGQG